ncbi:docking protein 1-like isoform X2 [Echeneis naucrates]|uniref:docking protein 1-like isoform X2 n=1 Tax=Echeneis naucrates TaxID=173247 RepID=UPI0011135E23|nr:docking protein 1-like isoform X2 [Echeneis naucrates]
MNTWMRPDQMLLILHPSSPSDDAPPPPKLCSQGYTSPTACVCLGGVTYEAGKPVSLRVCVCVFMFVSLSVMYPQAGGREHGTGVRRHHQPLGDRKMKVVPLSELISILRLPPNAEACPMDNMAAFCVETRDRTMVFAALKDDCMDWVEKLCRSTFQRGGSSGSSELHMEENQIYASAEQASEFWVVVQRTEAAVRCGLQGSYWLQVGREALLLRESQKKSNVKEWPYELLRRYGRDQVTLTIEAGRRCDSGPGTFTFETEQAEKIFSLIQSTIKRKTFKGSPSNHEQVAKKIKGASPCSHSPVLKLPDAVGVADFLGGGLRMEDRKSPILFEKRSVHSQPPPITLMPLPLVPELDSPSGGCHSNQSDIVYANPADCIQSAPKLSTAQYIDPASVLPLKPPVPLQPGPNTQRPDSVYSEVYDKLSPRSATRAPIQTTQDEPIYTEPESQDQKETPRSDRKLDPFAHLYAQVSKPGSSPGRSKSPNSTPSCPTPPSSVGGNTTPVDSGQCPDDVIYENLGII